jgi:hypothetical protein
MRTVIDTSEATAVATVVTAGRPPATMTTTLYDLIAAVQDVVGPDNDAMVVATVRHMLRASRATWGSDVAACDSRGPEPLRGRRLHMAVSA